MKAYKFNHQDRRFAPWAALCVLSLVAAMVFAAPSVVFAQITGELSQDCDFALIGTEQVITAKVTENGVPGATVLVGFISTDPYGQYFAPASFDANGIATFPYQVDSVGQVEMSLFWIDQSNGNKWVFLDTTITTNWTADEADLCSSSQQVLVGGRLTLNAKKRGALKIAVCGTDDLEVSNVDPKTVQLAGVAPWHWKQKDSHLCPDGKDGVVDLVFKFKNREVVEALEKSTAELADVDHVDLALTGNLYDGTPFGGEWVAEIEREGKRHWKKEHHQKKDKNDKGPKK